MQALWMLLASLFFASMGVCIKFASVHFNSFEIVTYRGLVGVIFLYGFTRVSGVSLRTRVPMMHVWRSVIGTISLTAWFYAIAVLPLATAMTLNYMSSVWIATFAWRARCSWGGACPCASKGRCSHGAGRLCGRGHDAAPHPGARPADRRDRGPAVGAVRRAGVSAGGVAGARG
jgi:hypothetical protein